MLALSSSSHPFSGFIINESGERIVVVCGYGTDDSFYAIEGYIVFRIAEDGEILGVFDCHYRF